MHHRDQEEREGLRGPAPGTTTLAVPTTTSPGAQVGTAVKNIGAAIGGALARFFSALGAILTMPSTVQAPTLPPRSRMQDEQQEPPADTSSNADGDDNAADTSENESSGDQGGDKKESSKGKEKSARDLIGGSGKKSRSYHSELENLTDSELKQLSRKGGADGAAGETDVEAHRDRDRLRDRRNKS